MANETGSLLPITNIWDVDDINAMDVKSPQFKELLVRMYQNINLITTSLNVKFSGYYDVIPKVSGNKYFPLPGTNAWRGSKIITINFGALPNTATKSVAHGLTMTSGFIAVRLYATASDTTGKTYIPIPYASPTLANNIELNVDATNVNITTGSNRTNYNQCYVVFEYLEF